MHHAMLLALLYPVRYPVRVGMGCQMPLGRGCYGSILRTIDDLKEDMEVDGIGKGLVGTVGD